MVIWLWVLGVMACLFLACWLVEMHERAWWEKQAGTWQRLYMDICQEIDDEYPEPPIPRRWK